jgi:hypothetical protein
MLNALAVVAGAGVIAWAIRHRGDAQATHAGEAARGRQLAILSVFAQAIAGAPRDPVLIVAWQPVAQTARALFPEEVAAIERAAGKAFPFSSDVVREAHAKWTTEWLAWERSHDLEFKRRAAAARPDAGAPLTEASRAALDAIENEKLDLYQRRYAEYVSIAKSLQALSGS